MAICSMEHRMILLDIFKKDLGLYYYYKCFENIISAILLIIVSIIIVYSVALAAITVVRDFGSGVYFAQTGALKDTFGLILVILILIEFNHSIVLAMQQGVGVLQVRIIVLITIIVILRKLILLDYSNTTLNAFLGLGALALSLGALYWLLTDVERRLQASAPTK
jgi:uncharacterized membrane protein (DUF373 family)